MLPKNPCFYLKLEKMKYKAIIFDLDGTLVDTLDDLTEAMNQALVHLGQPVRSREECREMIGRGLSEFARSALPPARRPANDNARNLCGYLSEPDESV
jgi:phosphoglycolate phosphatase-like HAD superfamily hydrolase